MSLCVLSVAYPFAPVSADPVGGAEQVLAALDRALVQRGWRSVVAAAEGSTPAGALEPLPILAGELGAAARAAAYQEIRRRIELAIARHRPDVVHLHGVDFHEYLPAGPPSLVTLHLPLAWYPPHALDPQGCNAWLAPVSEDQVRRGPTGLRLLPPVENGVAVERFRPRRKRGYALAIGRICPEKGFHLALDAARVAGMPLLLAGQVFPYAEHRRYFESEIRPRLDRWRRWVGPVRGRAKCALMAAANCLVAPSLAPETSSLVAREALAAGTPVVALRNGALVEAVEQGRTGILVDTPDALPEALARAATLDPAVCRQTALQRFSAGGMIDRYFDLYRRLAAERTPAH